MQTSHHFVLATGWPSKLRVNFTLDQSRTIDCKSVAALKQRQYLVQKALFLDETAMLQGIPLKRAMVVTRIPFFFPSLKVKLVDHRTVFN